MADSRVSRIAKMPAERFTAGIWELAMKTVLTYVIAIAADALLLLVLSTQDLSENALAAVTMVGFAGFYLLAAFVIGGGFRPSPERKLRHDLREKQKWNFKNQGGTYYGGMSCPHCGAQLTSGGIVAKDGWEVNMDSFDKQAMKEGILKCATCGTLLRL